MVAGTHADLRNPAYVAWRDFLRAADSWSKGRITDYQGKQVRKILEHAYEGSSGYRELYQSAGFHPGDFTGLGDLHRVPLVTKEDIRDRLEEFSVANEDGEYVTTGGSTGIPFGFYRTREAFARELASKAHQYARIGWFEDDRQFVLRGVPVDTPDSMQLVVEFNELLVREIVNSLVNVFLTTGSGVAPMRLPLQRTDQ